MANIIDIYGGTCGGRVKARRVYLRYLMDLVELKPRYTDLCDTLLAIEFEPIIGNDSDRCVDGLDIRREYEGGDYTSELNDDSPCSMMEMLVALAIRTAKLMDDGDGTESPGYYFMIFLENLGLDNVRNMATIQRTCDEFMDPFIPEVDIVRVNHPPKRWSKMEIWKKVNWFLTEMYYENC